MLRLAFWVTLILSCSVSFFFLANRNLWDDELWSFCMICGSYSHIWDNANRRDVHPAGMYMLLKFFYELTGSERWATLGPIAALYTGLIYFCHKGIGSLSRNPAAYVVFLAVCLLNGHVLLWGSSLRWYPYWTGLGLLVLCIALQVGKPIASLDIPKLLVCVVVCVLLAVMFYICYASILFVPAFSAAWVARYSLNANSLRKLIAIIAGCLFLSLPQSYYFAAYHLVNASHQVAPIKLVMVRLFFSVLSGDALLPWHPISLMCCVIFGILLIVVFKQVIGNVRRQGLGHFEAAEDWQSLAVFWGVFLVLAVITGLGFRGRGFMILNPILGLLLAHGIQILDKPKFNVLALAITALWVSFSTTNLVLRQGLTKSQRKSSVNRV